MLPSSSIVASTLCSAWALLEVSCLVGCGGGLGDLIGGWVVVGCGGLWWVVVGWGFWLGGEGAFVCGCLSALQTQLFPQTPANTPLTHTLQSLPVEDQAHLLAVWLHEHLLLLLLLLLLLRPPRCSAGW